MFLIRYENTVYSAIMRFVNRCGMSLMFFVTRKPLVSRAYASCSIEGARPITLETMLAAQ